MEAIVLAGGFGTRLKSVIGDIPKPMAPIGGAPFLEHVLEELNAQGFSRAVLAVGFRSEMIEAHFGRRYKDIRLVYSREDAPLGTGGAIKLALLACEQESAFILNGDTFLELPYAKMKERHVESKADVTVASVWAEDAGRYGTLTLDDSRILSFREKQAGAPGYINAGVYCAGKDLLRGFEKDAFSFENEFMAPFAEKYLLMAYISGGYFIDIGVPADYAAADIHFSAKAKRHE